MEQADIPHSPDPQAGSVTQDATPPSRPDRPAAAEGVDTSTPPTDDTDFEPV